MRTIESDDDDETEVIRKNLYESGNDHSDAGGQGGGQGGGHGHGDPRGIFAETDTDTDADADTEGDAGDADTDGQAQLKKALGTDAEGSTTVAAVSHGDEWQTGPATLTEPSGDPEPVRKDLQARVEKATAGELDTLGIFETHSDLLRDVRDLLDPGRPGTAGGISKSVESESERGGGAGGPYSDLLDALDATIEIAEALVTDGEGDTDTDADIEDWEDLGVRVEQLLADIRDAPDPETPADWSALQSIEERAAELADLLDRAEDSTG